MKDSSDQHVDASSLSSLSDSFGDFDAELIQILERYEELRRRGEIQPQEFVSQHSEYADQLPELLASIDALEGFAPDRHFLAAADLLDGESEKPLINKTLGDYHIVREIGRGGMGIVYEAEQRSLGRRVALKVLPLSVVLDEQKISRFMVEAQSAAQLHHPNIVPIYSVGREDGIHCYSMPLIDGVSLDDRISTLNQDATLSGNSRNVVATSVRLVIQAARALEHAHQRGVIHRDIKPSNLMVDKTDKLWVTDFGLARCRQDSSLTQSGAIVGTLRYMSPEQTLGKPQAVDHRSDIYSLGITLYELVIGCPAFDEGPRAQLLAQRQHTEPLAPRKVNRKLPRDLETIILRSIAIEPAQRYQTSEEFADDLQRFSEGKPILARRPSVTDRIAKWTSRYRKAVAVAAALMIIGLIGSLVATTKLRDALDVADANLAESQENFRRTREVLDHFGLLAAERLRGVAGAEEIREELVRDLLAYYEDFVVTASSTPDLDLDLATTHFRAARIMEESGARTRARKAYERANVLFDHLAKQATSSAEPSPSVHDLKFQIGLCQNNIGLLLAESDEFDRAQDHFLRAIQIQSELADVMPRAKRELANVHGNLGLLLAAIGQTSDAETELRTSMNILESIDRSLPNRSARQTKIAMATTLNNLGYLFQETSVDKAIAFNDRSILLLRTVVANEEQVPQSVSRALATSLNNQAALFAKRNRVSESLASYRESISIYRDLVERSPLVTQFSEELAISYNNFGRLLTRGRRYHEARMALERSRDLLEMLARRRPQEARYHASLGGVLNNLAKVAMASGDLDRAIEELEASLAAQEKLDDSGTSSPAHREMLATTYINFETALRKSGRYAKAEMVKSLRTNQ